MFNFHNSYIKLSQDLYTKSIPAYFKNPHLDVLNTDLADQLDILISGKSNQYLARVFSGQEILENSEIISQSYAGHQFGHFNILGDGRAHLLGEHLTSDNKRFDIQLKGSGPTEYSRRGDGLAAYAPMIREYLISEAMHYLGVPTSRSLAVVKTGEPVYREEIQKGAILTRVASSHIRVGTFEYAAYKKNTTLLTQLADYSINRHYPGLKDASNPYIELLKTVMNRQIDLVVNWMRVGFVHGVLNTDNVTISGETIDYGPCAFIDSYDPNITFSSIDRNGRYAFGNQPHITNWNITRFAESLLILLDPNIDKSVTIAEEVIKSYSDIFASKWLKMMRSKLGLLEEGDSDKKIISDLLKIMEQQKLDYTNVFRDLSNFTFDDKICVNEFNSWYNNWYNTLKNSKYSLNDSKKLMKANNPSIIPRNHNVELALLEASENSNLTYFNKLLKILKSPYSENHEYGSFKIPSNNKSYKTFCGT